MQDKLEHIWGLACGCAVPDVSVDDNKWPELNEVDLWKVREKPSINTIVRSDIAHVEKKAPHTQFCVPNARFSEYQQTAGRHGYIYREESVVLLPGRDLVVGLHARLEKMTDAERRDFNCGVYLCSLLTCFIIVFVVAVFIASILSQPFTRVK